MGEVVAFSPLDPEIWRPRLARRACVVRPLARSTRNLVRSRPRPRRASWANSNVPRPLHNRVVALWRHSDAHSRLAGSLF
ncbi:unnamed protein product [Protopolystoma xenopodis]|uniref:Uncharacterized protein n=1 Tax=Protopolystoma xenopodis TaxID=117903 RepID=A0A3S5CG18_9PLAT|nr:unnamed protein product [Protopolystoma xenopodis]